ncbi:hypothetical protein IWW34DRAFT_788300 [Fusarium oxysporum f. sp. albedinis]|nr:hypothetical protein IWW34DRAFT_788300 [Fusarium oxysporum f. sp. albedinis]
MPGRSPYNIGHDDLNLPGLSPHNPLRGLFTSGLPRPGGSSEVKEAINDPASILMCRLELDRIPLALVETQDPLVPVTEGEAIHLAETSFKHSGISINELL